MSSSDPIRDEAERLVATAIGMLSMAARGLGAGARFGSGPGGSFATGSEECCVCPICRVIAAMRDPDPGLADKLASGAGDLATAVAGILRTFGRADQAGSVNRTTPPPRSRSDASDDDAWRAATTQTPPEPPSPSPAPKAMAKKAVKKAAKKAVPAAGPASSGLRSEASAASESTREDGASKAPRPARAKRAAKKQGGAG